MTSPQIPSNIKALILDMDGVLWKADQPLVDLPAVFKKINSHGLQVVLATNNATRSAISFQRKLASLGVELATWQIVTSSQAAAHLLHKRYPQGGTVYVVGEQGLVDTLAEAGFIHGEKDAIAVVAALDRQLTYAKLKKAALLINQGCLFLATNQDATLPTPEGMIPGAGAIVAALQTATGQLPLVAGKPNPIIYQLAFERLGILPHQALAVGDRLETDIAGGITAGCKTALVLSGASQLDDVHNLPIQPDFIYSDLASLVGL